MITISPSIYSCLWYLYRKRPFINEEIEKLRLSTTSSFSGRRDVLVVPLCPVYMDWKPSGISKKRHYHRTRSVISRTKLLHQLVQSLYSRTTADFNHGNFRVKGDVVIFSQLRRYCFSRTLFWR